MRKFFKRVKDYIFADKRVFAQGLTKEKLFLMFVFGCVFGCVYEEILNLSYTYRLYGIAIYETRRGLLWGELSPVYGFGCVLMLMILFKRKRHIFEYFSIGALIGGVYEYIMSFLQETLTGSISWDYSTLPLNVNGRTTIPFMLVWGLLALVLVYVFYPVGSKIIEKIPYNLGMIIYRVLVVFVCLDFAITYTAVGRQTLRNAGYPPFTQVGIIMDKYFPNERIAQAFTNAEFK